MKDDLVVVMLLGQPDEILDRLGCLVREQIKVNITFRRVNGRTSSSRTTDSCCRRCDGHLVPRRFLVEHVAVAVLVPVGDSDIELIELKQESPTSHIDSLCRLSSEHVKSWSLVRGAEQSRISLIFASQQRVF